MPLFGLSTRGLLVISFLVAVLWACILAEHHIVREARRATDLELHSRRNIYPASIQQTRTKHPGRRYRS